MTAEATSNSAPSVLLPTGPPGVGKTTVMHEVSRQLGAAGVAHAFVDLDNLRSLHTKPPSDVLRELTRKNLAAVWGSFASLGCHRFIVASVLADPGQNSRCYGMRSLTLHGG